MSASSFVSALEPQPAPTVARLVEQVLRAPSALQLEDGEDPMEIAARASLSVVETLAALGALLSAKMGRFFVRVVDEDGVTLREYDSLDQVDAVIVDDFDIRHHVDPQQTQVLFRANPPLLAFLVGRG